MISNIETRLRAMIQAVRENLGIPKDIYLAQKIKARLEKSVFEYKQQLDKSLKSLITYCENYDLSLIRKLNKGD